MRTGYISNSSCQFASISILNYLKMKFNGKLREIIARLNYIGI